MERHDLFDALSDAMSGVARPELFGGRMTAGRVKSRLIEAHPPEASGEGVDHLLRSVIDGTDLAVERIGDDLWALLGSEEAFFLDGLNSRFWLLHSTASAESLRRLVRRYLLPAPGSIVLGSLANSFTQWRESAAGSDPRSIRIFCSRTRRGRERLVAGVCRSRVRTPMSCSNSFPSVLATAQVPR